MSATGRYRRPPIPTPAYAGTERRTAHPLALLSRQLNGACLHITGPLELASLLETLGYRETYIQATYQLADVFELAEALYALTAPARARATSPRASFWQRVLLPRPQSPDAEGHPPARYGPG